ncbi:uncharacterized protein V1518DRAFT_377765 [Limtongia smithiae]|uniref:uncharacterized protein n=1 Tax=Limtongia smithiae TaxID=1125753 RepID=UPI0034CD467D
MTWDRKLIVLAALVLATASSVTSVFGTLAYQSYDRKRKLAALKAAIGPDSDDRVTPSISRTVSQDDEIHTRVERLNEYGIPAAHAREVGLGTIPEDYEGKKEWDPVLIDEQLARNRIFLGDEGLAKVRKAFVIVVGCGGVGSWAVTMLVRSGVGKLRIIDFDQVTLSSLNRHASATLEDVGIPKVESLRRFLEKVAPWVEVETHIELWRKESAAEMLRGTPTIVVDAIDNIDTKVDLLEYCYRNRIEVISAMGAGCKSDPTRIQIGDISGSIEDPLARATRRRLRMRGITTGIMTVFSSEKPAPDKVTLLPLDQKTFEKGKVDELSVLHDFRARILPVLGTMPGMFGLALATHIITHIGGYPVGEYIIGRNRVKTYDSVLHNLAGQKMRLEGSQKLPLDMDDVGYIIEEVFRGRSVVSREAGGNRVALTKWDPAGDWTSKNVVLMSKEEAKVHEERVLKGGTRLEDAYPPEVHELVRKRFEEEKWYSRFRE